MTFQKNHRKSIIAIFIFLTLLAMGIRLFRLDNQSLWTDEVSSILTARASLDKISEMSATLNNCPPTYFLALRPIVGTSNDRIEVKGRLLSALAGSLSVAVFMGVVWFWRHRWKTALIAGAALAINPLHLWYSQEVRAYSVMLLFGLGTLLAFELVWARRRFVWWLAYFVLAFAAMGIHKTGLTFALFCLLRQGFEFIRRRENFRALCIHAIVLVVAGIVLNLKSYPPTKEYGRPNSILEIAYTAMTFVGGYSFGPSLTDIQSHGPAVAVSRHMVQVGIIGIVMALFAVAFMLRLRAMALSKENGLLLVGIGVVVAGSLVSHFPYNVRYALPALFGFLGLVAVLATECFAGKDTAKTSDETNASTQQQRTRLSLWLGRVLGCGVLIVSLWSDFQWFFNPNYRKGDSRAVAQWLVEHQSEIKTWTVLPDYLGISVRWYLESYPEIQSRFLPPKEPQNTSFPPVPDVLIIGRRHHVPQAEQIIHSYRSVAGNVETVHSVAGFELFVRRPERSHSARATPGSWETDSLRDEHAAKF
jgi:hypothetical protein